MKALKILGFTLAALLLIVVVLVALALTPSIQTWAVRKAMADQPGMKLEVGRVAAGLSAADISDVRFSQNGMIVTAKGVTARYSAWDYLTKNRINADNVTVEELLVDMRNVKPAADAEGKAPGSQSQPGSADAAKGGAKKAKGTRRDPKSAQPFEGVLKSAQLPFDVRVANLSAKGRALLTENQTVVFDLKGSGIETGQRGKLEWTVDFGDSKSDAALRGLRATGTGNIHIAGDRRIDLVEIDTVAAAMGPKLPSDRVQITARLEQPTAGGNEGYAANISLLRGNTSESLLKTTAQFTAASREISGAWDLAVRTEQLAALLAGLGLPEIAATGGGKFNLKPETSAVSATGDLSGSATKLEKISPTLAGIGGANFKLTFDGGIANEQTRSFLQTWVDAYVAWVRKLASV